MKIPNWVILLILFLVIFDGFVWFQVFAVRPDKNAEIYALDVGQGDSELVILPPPAGSGQAVKILIDGGPDNKVLNELASILPATDRYIDLVILSHPQTDHMNGLIDVLKRYKVGAFIWNGLTGQAQSFKDLNNGITENKILAVSAGEGDKIKYNNNYFEIISPSKELLKSKGANDAALVFKLNTPEAKILFTGDIDSKIEENLAKKYDLNVDILKVSHHGSKFSTSLNFLKAVNPKIAFIEVGKNSYGHPTPQALNNLAYIGSQIFRTDQNGTIKLIIGNSEINILKTK